jgi:hypothetical protein
VYIRATLSCLGRSLPPRSGWEGVVANAMLAPVALLGRGGSPVFLSFRSPRIEGNGAPRRRPGCPGLPGCLRAYGDALVAQCVRASRRATAASGPFAFHGSRPTGVVVRLTRLLWEPLGDVIAYHARKCRIPPHYTNAFAKAPLDGRDIGNIS